VLKLFSSKKERGLKTVIQTFDYLISTSELFYVDQHFYIVFLYSF